MYGLMKILGLLVFLVTTGINCQSYQCVNEMDDPCLPTNHMYITDHTRSTAYTDHDLSYEADSNLIEGWYRDVSGAGGDMPLEAPPAGQCQASVPIWLNGTLPLMEEGIVGRLACGKLMSECDVKIDICVKNCSDFHVYYLPRPENSFERYCFGSELPCPLGFTSQTGFSPKCVATTTPDLPSTPTCIYEVNDPCLDGNHMIMDDHTRSANYSDLTWPLKADHGLIEGWYRIMSTAGGDMPTWPPGHGKCQATNPIWLKDNLPASGEGIVQKTGCVQFLSDCSSTIDICVKNCPMNYNVYYLYKPTIMYSRYCFGTEVPCPAGTSSPSGFPPNCAPNIPIPPPPHCIHQHINPCLVGNHLILDDETRSAVYNNPDCGYKTDVGMTEGWYRAIGAAGGDMPMRPPMQGMCQAESPIWMIGSLPRLREGIVANTACVRDRHSICADTIHICVKNCGYFNVYHLSRTVDATQRYCFGDQMPRDPGMLSHDCQEFTEPAAKHHHLLATAIETTLIVMVLVGSVAIIVLIGYKCKKREKKVVTVAPWEPVKNQEQPPPYSEKHGVQSSDMKISNLFMTSEVTKNPVAVEIPLYSSM